MCKGGRNCVKYFKRGWNRKEGRGNKKIKGGRASWVKGLTKRENEKVKRGRGLEPLYKLCTHKTTLEKDGRNSTKM